jgi:hypothetical protein
MRQAAVLALDLATTTGWALHRPGMQRPFFHAFTLPGGPRDVGEPAAALEEWLRDKMREMRAGGGISHFFYEAQHITPNINMETTARLIGLAAIVDKFAFQTKAKAYSVDIGTWRKHFIGRGSGFKREKVWNEKKQKMVNGKYLPGEDPKELAVQRCEQYGWHTDIHDAAEACGILDYSLTLLPDYHRPWRDKLLMQGAR